MSEVAIGVSFAGVAPVGDGVPGTEFIQIPKIFEGSVAFNFSDAKEIPIPVEGSDDPLDIILRKGEASSIELAIPTPTTDQMVMFAGGSKLGEKWSEPITVPSINKTLKLESEEYKGQKLQYIIVNAKVQAKISQAPGKEQTELLLVKFTQQTAMTEAGAVNSGFSREIVTV